ncbi:MAG: protein kinase [Gammaproteobacteria bacterium]|nr:protein kinase [Gammaproteobacteria bacterium]
MDEPSNKSSDSNKKDESQDSKETARATSSDSVAADSTVLDGDKTRIPQRSQSKRENQRATGKPPLAGQTDADATRYDHPGVDVGQDNTRVPSKSSASTMTGKVPMPAGKDSLESDAEPEHIVLKDRFLLEEVIGVGGMGVVHKARDRLKVEARDKDPYVAIKMLSDEFNSHPEAFIALQRESRKTQRLTHPNIVKVFDFDKDGDDFFMTMEYMAGKPLNRLIKQYSRTGLPWDDAWAIIEGMCSALAYAHVEKIIHADFKPGNILVTTSGVVKIFDFGIARAVKTVEKTDGWPVHKTIFDTASLGGLTPAYASYEMLNGQEPDIRDDIYALGCIIYELFTGQHPFDKMPADKAKNKGLRPKRIDGLKKWQWKALEKALAFERENRIESVDEFYRQLTATHKPRYMLIATAVVVASALGFAYVQEEKITVEPVSVSEHDIRSELEFNIRLGLYKEELERLVANPSFTTAWEENVWKEYQGVKDLLPSNDSWLAETKKNIFSLYLNKVQAEIKSSSFRYAGHLIENALKYSNSPTALEAEKLKLAEAIKEKEGISGLKKPNTKTKAVSKVDEYTLALSNVNKQLTCRTGLNMRDFDIAVNKLRSLGPKKYSKIKNDIISSLATCISKQGKRFPEKAIEWKKYALRLFGKNSLIGSIRIISRDACDGSIAGLGARGERAVCRDLIKDVGYGPDLVVVPGGKNIKSFAVGKYEVSIAEFNQYCLKTRQCSLSEKGSDSVPVTGQPVKVVKGYLKWLSNKTGRKYRLPTRDEWIYAAASATKAHDPNRNCQFRSRGIQKGDGLVKTTTGKQNSWGLVNYLGNVQEWGYDKTGRLVAMGGAYIDSMEGCQISTWQHHPGQPDYVTGFRVLRELTARK